MDPTVPSDYHTRIERFQLGDFPLVCVRSGRTDEVALRPAVADARALLSFKRRWFEFQSRVLDPLDTVPGYLPYAPDEPDLDASFVKGTLVVLHDAHPNFVKAVKAMQGRTE